MENEEYIVLTDESGNETAFELLHYLEYNGNEYVVLFPVDESEDVSEVVILKIEETGNPDEESYVSVDNEEDLQAVFELFKNEFEDDFNFVD